MRTLGDPERPLLFRDMPFSRHPLRFMLFIVCLVAVWFGSGLAERLQMMLVRNHCDGLAILLVPFFGLFAICRGGKWHWNVVEQFAGPDLEWGKTFNVLIWVGWFTGLICGILRICGLC
jgi:hypothetical protein